MGQPKTNTENTVLSVTVSFRVGIDVMTRVEEAANRAEVTRSDLLRELLTRVTPSQLDDAIRAVQLTQLDVSETQSAAMLKQKKGKAEKLIAWIDAELMTRAQKIQSGAKQT